LWSVIYKKPKMFFVGGKMAEKLDPKEMVSFEELLMSNVYTQEALINLLDAKGFIKKAELLEEIKKIRDKQKFGKA
jgi:hypothetical protein